MAPDAGPTITQAEESNAAPAVADAVAQVVSGAVSFEPAPEPMVRDSSNSVIGEVSLTSKTSGEPTSESAAGSIVDAVPLGVGATIERSKPAVPITPIVYGLSENPTLDERIQLVMAEENAVRLQRSEKFGTPMVKVRDVDILGARRAAVRNGFRTGFDVTSKEEMEQRRRRAERFGIVDNKTEEEVNAIKAHALEKRRTAAKEEPKRENALHLHGVDELSTQDISNFFRPYGSSWVEWIDDSSCNIVFEDEYTVGRILKFMRRNYNRDALHTLTEPMSAMETETGESSETMQTASTDIEELDDLEWREATPAQAKERTFRLWMRMATVKDRRPDLPNPNSKWSRTMRRMRDDMDVDSGSSRRRRPSRSRRRSRNTMSGVAGKHIKKESRDVSVDLDRALSSR